MDPDGITLDFSYDDGNRLLTISDSSNRVVIGYTYGLDGKLATRTLPNGIYTEYEHDSLGRITGIRNLAQSGAVISEWTYGYSGKRRIWAIGPNGREDYDYDSNYQLLAVRRSNSTSDYYAYDKNGNWTQTQVNGQLQTYSANALNQYSRIGNGTIGYDPLGDLVTPSGNDNLQALTYNNQGQLIDVELASGAHITYGYNAFGLLSSRTDAQGTILYLWDGGHIAVEETPDHVTSKSFVWGAGAMEPTTLCQAQTCYYYLQDGLGNVSELTDATGLVVEQYQSTAFGQVNQASNVGNPLLFAAARFDSGTGLYSMGYRWYYPSLGRFIQPDPAGLLGGVNGYTYVANSPLSAFDPYGLFSWSDLDPTSHSSIFGAIIDPIGTAAGLIGGKLGAYVLGNSGDIEIQESVGGFISGAMAGYKKGGFFGAVGTGFTAALFADLGGDAGMALCGGVVICGKIGAMFGSFVGTYIASNIFCTGDGCNNSSQLFVPQGKGGGASCNGSCASTGARPGASLLEIIQAQQFANVKPSYGVWAYECVTWDDLAQFQTANTATQIASALLSSIDFQRDVANLRSAPATLRTQMLNVVRRPLRPTWAQQGFIGPSGQTDAGQQEELLIANAIVDLVTQLLQ